MENYTVWGSVNFEVSKVVQAVSEEKALVSAYEQVNDYNVKVKKVTLELENGQVVEMDVHDVNVNWNEVLEEE